MQLTCLDSTKTSYLLWYIARSFLRLLFQPEPCKTPVATKFSDKPKIWTGKRLTLYDFLFQGLFSIFQWLYCLRVLDHDTSNPSSFSFLSPVLCTVENCTQLRKAPNSQIQIYILIYFRFRSCICLIFIKPLVSTYVAQQSSMDLDSLCSEFVSYLEEFCASTVFLQISSCFQSQTLILISFPVV